MTMVTQMSIHMVSCVGFGSIQHFLSDFCTELWDMPKNWSIFKYRNMERQSLYWCSHEVAGCLATNRQGVK